MVFHLIVDRIGQPRNLCLQQLFGVSDLSETIFDRRRLYEPPVLGVRERLVHEVKIDIATGEITGDGFDFWIRRAIRGTSQTASDNHGVFVVDF